MVTIVRKPQPGETASSRARIVRPTYTFKPARELPVSKPNYVVLSPTPLGQRAVSEDKKDNC